MLNNFGIDRLGSVESWKGMAASEEELQGYHTYRYWRFIAHSTLNCIMLLKTLLSSLFLVLRLDQRSLRTGMLCAEIGSLVRRKETRLDRDRTSAILIRIHYMYINTCSFPSSISISFLSFLLPLLPCFLLPPSSPLPTSLALAPFALPSPVPPPSPLPHLSFLPLSASFPLQMSQLLSGGLPHSLRPRVWQLFLASSELQSHTILLSGVDVYQEHIKTAI